MKLIAIGFEMRSRSAIGSAATPVLRSIRRLAIREHRLGDHGEPAANGHSGMMIAIPGRDRALAERRFEVMAVTAPRRQLAIDRAARYPGDVSTVHAHDAVPRVVFDMETRDPDDVLTLCLLATHPGLRLIAVTVNPGTAQQIAVVREVLHRLERSVLIGARDRTSKADAVSAFHTAWLGGLADREPDGFAHAIMAAAFGAEPDAVLLTGAPLHNLRNLLREHPAVMIQRWVAQGGFAGDNVVPPQRRLAKFDGRTLCESFNFGGDKKATQVALASPQIRQRDLVSKNVTHGFAWNQHLQSRLLIAPDLHAGAVLARDAMSVYLREHPEGKLLHDPLAACAIVDRDAFSWEEIEVLYERGQWGATLRPGTGTFITVAVDPARVEVALFAKKEVTS